MKNILLSLKKKKGKAAGIVLMRYKLLDNQILKTWKSANENQDFFPHYFFLITCTPVARLYKLLTSTTQASETVFVSLFSACSNSQSSHLSPKCFPILLIRTKGVLPTLFRMFGRILGGSGLVQTQTKSEYSQKGHTTTTTQRFWCFLFQPAFSFSRPVIFIISV